MVQRRKDPLSSRNVKRTSDQVRSSMVGAHVPRAGKPGGRHMNADAVGFSSPRKSKRAARGQIDTFMPSSTTRESQQAYSRRAGRREYAQAIQRKSRVKRFAIVAICVLVAVAVAVTVGLTVFFTSVSGRMSLGDSNAREALVAPAEDQHSWFALMTAELGAAQGFVNEDGPEAYALVRVDEDAHSVSLVWMPANLQLTYGDGERGRLRDAAAVDDATLIKAVSQFAGVDIAHFAETDLAGICHLVDSLGGITVTLDEEVDDPRAGDVYIPHGEQTLGSAQLATALRATNYTDGLSGQARVQCRVIAAIMEKLASGQSPLTDAALLDSISGDASTDLDSQQAMDLASAFTGLSAGSIAFFEVPGDEIQRDGKTVFSAWSDDWTALMAGLGADASAEGQQPAATKDADADSGAQTVNVDPASFTITVRNGAGITGAASQMADQLRAGGFNVADIGNTDSPVYDETLVIYKDPAFEQAAQSVASALTSGRVVNGGDYYTFDTDVLVVLGADWKPLN